MRVQQYITFLKSPAFEHFKKKVLYEDNTRQFYGKHQKFLKKARHAADCNVTRRMRIA